MPLVSLSRRKLVPHYDRDAHFLQPGTHTFSDSVSQRFLLVCQSRSPHGGLGVEASRRQVGVVGRQNRGAAVVVVGVQDLGLYFPDPPGGLASTELIQHQNLSFENRVQDLRRDRRICPAAWPRHHGRDHPAHRSQPQHPQGASRSISRQTASRQAWNREGKLVCPALVIRAFKGSSTQAFGKLRGCARQPRPCVPLVSAECS